VKKDLLELDQATLLEYFDTFDIKGHGELSYSQLVEMGLKLNVSADKMRAMISAIDTDGDGAIQKSEWLAYIKKLEQFKESERLKQEAHVFELQAQEIAELKLGNLLE